MPSTGWVVPTSNSVGAGFGTWTNDTNIRVDDGSEASFSLTSKNTDGRWNQGQNFGFGTLIPADKVIDKVEIRVEWRVVNTGGVANLDLQAFVSNAAVGAVRTNSAEPTTLTTETFDITADKTWVWSDLIDGNFDLRVRGRNGNSTTDPDYRFDYVAVQVTYSDAVGPQYRGKGVLSYNTTSVTPTAPIGLTANDIEFLICESQAATISLTTSAGFTQVTGSPIDVPNATATVATHGALYWRRWNGSDGDPTVAFTTNHILAQRVAFNNCQTSGDPWDFIQISSEAVEDTSGTATGNNTLGDNRLIAVILGAAKPDSQGLTEISSPTNANLTSVTEWVDNAGNAGNGGHIGLITGKKATSGAVGDTTYTKATASYKWHYVIALKPPSVATVSQPPPFNHYRKLSFLTRF